MVLIMLSNSIGCECISNNCGDGFNITECPNGYFGADCSQRCTDCIEDQCDPFSGTCALGCKIGTDCRKGMSIDVMLPKKVE